MSTGDTRGADVGRREFFRRMGRYLVLGAVGACAGLVASRRGAGGRAGQTCGNRGICRGCPALAGCGLPQALSAKAAGAGGGGR